MLPLNLPGNASAADYYPFWERVYNAGPNSNEDLLAFRVDGNGNTYVAGTTCDSNALCSAFLACYAPFGEPRWAHAFLSGSLSNSLLPLLEVSGGLAYACGTIRQTSGETDLLILCADSAGAVKWTNRYDLGFALSESPKAIAVDPHSNLLVAGTTGPETLLVKVNPNGAVVWERVENRVAGESEWALDIAAQEDGGFSVLDRSNNRPFTYLRAFSATGTQVWERATATPFAWQHVAVARDGSTYVVGSTGITETTITKFTSEGTPVWTNGLGFYPDKYLDLPIDILVTPDQSALVVAGRIFIGKWRYAVARMTTNGIVEWAKVHNWQYLGGNLYLDSVAIDDSGHVYLGGTDGLVVYAPSGVVAWSLAEPGQAIPVDHEGIVFANDVAVSGQVDTVVSRFQPMNLGQELRHAGVTVNVFSSCNWLYQLEFTGDLPSLPYGPVTPPVQGVDGMLELPHADPGTTGGSYRVRAFPIP